MVINTTTYNKKIYEMVSAYWIIKQENNIIITNRYYFHKRL